MSQSETTGHEARMGAKWPLLMTSAVRVAAGTVTECGGMALRGLGVLNFKTAADPDQVWDSRAAMVHVLWAMPQTDYRGVEHDS